MTEKRFMTKLTLLLCASLTVMAGATIAPSLPQMTEVFSYKPRAEFLAKLVLTIPSLFIALFSPLAGWLTDKVGRLKLLFFSMVLYAAAGTSGLWLEDIHWILVGRALLGIAVGGIMTVISTLVGDYFEGKERDGFSALQGISMALGGVIFVSLGGILADLNWRLPFAIYFLSLVFLLFGLAYLRETAKKSSEAEQLPIPKYPRGIIGLIMVTMFLSMVFFYMIPVQIPYLLKDLGFDSNMLSGFAIALGTVGAALGAASYMALRKNFDYSELFGIAFVVLAVGYIVIGWSVQYGVLLVALFISGYGVGMLMPNGTLWTLHVTPLLLRGRIIGLYTSFVFMGQFFSPVIMQPFAKLFDLSGAFLTAGGASMALGVFFLFSNRLTVISNSLLVEEEDDSEE